MNGTQVVAAAARPAPARLAPARPAVAIRPALPADLAALGDFFAELSVQSRYLRFFAPVTPGPALLRRLAGTAGTLDAVIAVADGVIIGHAMAADRAASRGDRMTDIGVVVADAWQGGGIGSALVRALVVRAQARGVTAVAMDVLPGNHQVLAMIARHWPAARTGHAPDYVSIEIRLQQTAGRTSFASGVPAYVLHPVPWPLSPANRPGAAPGGDNLREWSIVRRARCPSGRWPRTMTGSARHRRRRRWTG